MEGGEKSLCVVFLADQKIAISWKKKRFGASYSTNLQKCLQSWQRKIRKFIVTAFNCEESMHRK